MTREKSERKEKGKVKETRERGNRRRGEGQREEQSYTINTRKLSKY